jgi:hypothetical protein
MGIISQRVEVMAPPVLAELVPGKTALLKCGALSGNDAGLPMHIVKSQLGAPDKSWQPRGSYPWSQKPVSKRVRNAKFQHPVNMPGSSAARRRLIEEKLEKFGHDASGHFDSEAWAALIAEHRRLIADAAGVDPSQVKIYVGH